MLIFLTLIDSDDGKERFVKIYNQYKNLMFYIAYQILENVQDAEDAVQDALFSIAKNIEKIKTVSEKECTKVKSFIVIVTERKAIDILRKRKTYESGELIEELVGYDYDYEGTDALTACIFRLPANYREVIILKHVMGYSLREIAEILGIKLNNAQRIEQRAKAKLKEICEAEGYDI